MRALKAIVKRLAAGVTGQAETHAALTKLRSRLESAAASDREARQRVKAARQELSDRLQQLERRAREDRGAVLEEIRRLREEQQAMHAELAALQRLAQRTYTSLVDASPLDEGAIDRAALAAHLRCAIAGAPMRHDPFPHLVIPDLLPADFYAQLRCAIPAPTFWRHAGHQRENWHVEEDSASRLSETTWRFMHRQIAAGEIMPLLLDRFAAAIEAYWRDTLGLDPSLLGGHYCCDEGRLLLRRPGYELEPHLDPPNAILTVLLFLAEPGAPDAPGTDLYASDPLPAIRAGIMYPARQGLQVERVASVPFRANTAVAFVTPQSVHGATLPGDIDPRFERVSYQFLVCLDDEARRIVRRRTRAEEALLPHS